MRKVPGRVLACLPIVLGLVALVHPVAGLGARWDWRLDLISHFQEPALAASLIAAAALARRHRRAAIAMLVLAIFQVEPVVRNSFPDGVRPADPSGPRLRILLSNVLVDNDGYGPLADLIRRTRPDVVGLVEVSDAWVAGLSDVARDYPYRLDVPDGPRGLSLWFKAPAAIDPPAVPTPDGWPYLHATFEFGGKVRHLWLLHPASPLRRMGDHPGFPELGALADRIAEAGGSTIVIGDLNTTDGSPYFRDLLAKTALRDGRRGFGRQPGWPVGWPYQIAIDHALVSADWAVLNRARGPAIGSDHRPFWIDVAPSAANAPRAASASVSISKK